MSVDPLSVATTKPGSAAKNGAAADTVEDSRVGGNRALATGFETAGVSLDADIIPFPTDREPSVKSGDSAGYLERRTSYFGSETERVPLHVEDVISGWSNLDDAKEAARIHSGRNGGENVAIIRETTVKFYPEPEYEKGEFQSRMYRQPQFETVFNVVTLDPAIDQSHAGELGSESWQGKIVALGDENGFTDATYLSDPIRDWIDGTTSQLPYEEFGPASDARPETRGRGHRPE